MNFRMATWNLDHASNSSRPKLKQIDKICEIAAHVIVLTETCREVDLSNFGYSGHWSTQNKYGKHYSAIWTKWPVIERVATCNPELASCVIVDAPFGKIAIYGTIFTYRDYRGSGNLKAWEQHLVDIASQGSDWRRIRDLIKDCSLIVAGDFNQTRDGVGVYKSPEALKALDLQLHQNNLVCVTEEDFGAAGKLKVDPELGRYRHNIDHICLPKDGFVVESVGAWDGFCSAAAPLSRLSDHNGVFVDIAVSRV